MKKIAIASIIALAAAAASAVELGVTYSQDYTAERQATGVTVGQRYGKVGVTAGFDRATKGADNQDRYSVVGSYDVATIGSATVDVRGGVAHLDNAVAQDGTVGLAGVGVRVPVTKQVSVTADITRQFGEARVNQFDGNRFTVGVTYGF